MTYFEVNFWYSFSGNDPTNYRMFIAIVPARSKAEAGRRAVAHARRLARNPKKFSRPQRLLIHPHDVVVRKIPNYNPIVVVAGGGL